MKKTGIFADFLQRSLVYYEPYGSDALAKIKSLTRAHRPTQCLSSPQLSKPHPLLRHREQNIRQDSVVGGNLKVGLSFQVLISGHAKRETVTALYQSRIYCRVDFNTAVIWYQCGKLKKLRRTYFLNFRQLKR